MKPPKSIRNIVNTLLGKKSKSTTKDFAGFEYDNHPIESLDKIERHHRSADDLLKEEPSDFNANLLPRSSPRQRSRSLPRRSQSCVNINEPSKQQFEPIYGRRVINGFQKDFTYQSEDERRCQDNHESTMRPSFRLARTYSDNSSSNISDRNYLPKRTRSHLERNQADETRRTTSWSHPHTGNNDFNDDFNWTHSKQVPLSRRDNISLQNTGRLSSHESDSQHSRSNSVARTSRDVSKEKLRTCLQVLDRLSAQVKEIKDVSKRVKYVDAEVKNGSMERGDLERRLRELDLAEAASQRLKNMIKYGAEDIPSTRHSSLSSGYDSENSLASGRSSALQQQQEPQRTSRAPGRTSHSQKSSSPYPGPTMAYQASQPYPQSVSDMMSIWDAKELESRSQKPAGRHMTREDSASSGYATASGSEDGRHDCPNDLDNVASDYSMQGTNHGHVQRQGDTNAWNQQHYLHHQQPHHFAGYSTEDYDQYAVYGTYPHHIPHTRSEDIYGNYGDVYGYATSSVYDHEIYNNGWYQLPSSGQSATGDSNHMPMAPATSAQDHGWAQMSYVAPRGNLKYGGLSDLFYDPTAQSDATLMETIANEVATDSQSLEDSNWKSYGSFRYRNGQRMITCSTNRKKVRFSQTVRQRVETEESEMEDSTSVIKGGEDEEENENGREESKNEDSSEEIYMWPRQHAGTIQSALPTQGASSNAQSKSLPEPIYEFPTGHIESSCMCSDCILARSSCQMQPAQAVSYF